METRRSYDHRWAFPPDLCFALGIPIIFVAVLTGWILEALFGARGGDPLLFWIGASIGVIGLVLLLLARLPLYRRHRFLSIGPRELTGRSRSLYRWAYCFLALSVVLLTALLLMTW